jgi:Tfp pilus assembly protein PilF
MAQFYADHDRNLVEALRLAEAHKLTKNPFEQDILAWCYHKNKQPQQAQAVIRRALLQKTSDARILFHAGMIYEAAGEPTDAQKYLYRAISLNPNFSPTLAPIATATLKKLSRQTAALATKQPARVSNAASAGNPARVTLGAAP